MFKRVVEFYKSLSVKNKTAVFLLFLVSGSIGIIKLFEAFSLPEGVIVALLFSTSLLILGWLEILRAMHLNPWTIFFIIFSFVLTLLLPFEYIVNLYNDVSEGGSFNNFTPYIITSIDWVHVFISLLVVFLIMFDKGWFYSRHRTKKLFVLLLIMFVSILGTKLLIIALTTSAKNMVLFLGISIFTDVFASAGGKSLKRFFPYKLAPKISPNKTWIGAITGYMGGIGFMLAYYFIFYNSMLFDPSNQLYSIVGWRLWTGVLLLPFIAIVGDLIFSYLKRIIYVKDFSSFIPGHGGVFDRIDSHIFVFAAIFLLRYIPFMVTM